MTAVGVMPMPADFSYRDVFCRGKPRHDRFDPFRLKHPAMDVGHRAKIFAPFDALKGFGEAVDAKNILYRQRIDLGQEDREKLDRRLRILRKLTQNGVLVRRNRVPVSVTCFLPCSDENSEAYGVGGRYVTVSGICRGVDIEVTRTIRVDRAVIDLADVLEIDSPAEIFEETIDTGGNENTIGGNNSPRR